MSSTLSLITTTAPTAATRDRAISLWAGANVLGLGVGPFLVAAASAVVRDSLSWHWAFAPVLVMAAAVAALGGLMTRETPRTSSGRVDIMGQGLGAMGAIALVFAAISAGSDGWSAPRTLFSLALAFIFLAVFVRVEQRAVAPTVPLSLFGSPRFVAAALAASIALFTVIGTVFVLSLFLTTRGASSLDIAVVIGSLFAGNALASLASGVLANRFDPGSMVLGGLVVAIGGVTALLSINNAITPGELALRLAILGIGCGTVVAASTVLAVHSAPAPLAAAAGITNNFHRQLGGALGAAVVGGVLGARLTTGVDPLSATHTSLTVLLAVLVAAATAYLALFLTSRAPPPLPIAVTHQSSTDTSPQGEFTMNTITHDLDLDLHGIGHVLVDMTERGTGHPFLLLHGGGGPQTVLPWAAHLSQSQPARVFTPVHPGFEGTTRPDGLHTIGGLAATYVALLDDLELHDVTVVGNSLGGWIAAEMATIATRRVSSYVLVDAVGIEVTGHPVADFFFLTPAEVSRLTFADPVTYGIDPATMRPKQLAEIPGNRAALETYASHAMTDPSLAARLSDVMNPTLVIWGEEDRIVDSDYGRAYAAAIPGADFKVLAHAGHLPQVEAPEALIASVWAFADTHATGGPNSPESS